ncbi:MAG TPA: hypothetical protein DCY88_24940 [Cyanobacteria bacterium UBA11372]|nr:hypothetical protein [Cyanobacteria bacterium UBA11372]
MTQPILQLGRADLWEEVHNTVYRSSGFVGRRPIPIPHAFVPLTFTNFVSAVWCSSPFAEDRKWQRGCKVSQVTPIGASIAGRNGAITETRIISQGIPTLLAFSQYTNEYSLRLDFYPWYQEIQVMVYQYNGVVSDTTTESLRNIQTSLNVIAQRLP